MPSFLLSRFIFFLFLSGFKGTAGKSIPEREALGEWRIKGRIAGLDEGVVVGYFICKTSSKRAKYECKSISFVSISL